MPDNPRGHPVLAALLYAACPAAARWWLSGVDPVLPFDPLWEVLCQRAAGKTLREVLEEWGLSALLPDARRYVERFEIRRAREARRSPDSIAVGAAFLEETFPFKKRFLNAVSLERMGGGENFFRFIYAWAFALQDWQNEIGLGPVQSTLLSTSIRVGPESPVLFPIWSLSDGRRETAVFFKANREECSDDLLREVLLVFSDEAFPSNLFSLDLYGQAERVRPRYARETLTALLNNLFQISEYGPYPPLPGLTTPHRCASCGFQPVCWGRGNPCISEITPLALDFYHFPNVRRSNARV